MEGEPNLAFDKADVAPPPPWTGGGRGVGEAAKTDACGTYPHPLAPSRKGRGTRGGAGGSNGW